MHPAFTRDATAFRMLMWGHPSRSATVLCRLTRNRHYRSGCPGRNRSGIAASDLRVVDPKVSELRLRQPRAASRGPSVRGRFLTPTRLAECDRGRRRVRARSRGVRAPTARGPLRSLGKGL